MVKQHRNLLNWRSLGTLAISIGIFSFTQASAKATPNNSQSSFKLAQVGLGNPINGPTPLNLRPRTHIPLPRVNGRSGSYYRYRRYRDRHYDGYGYGHDHYHTHRRRKHRHRRGPVIIINPAEYSEYSYDGYTRVIRK